MEHLYHIRLIGSDGITATVEIDLEGFNAILKLKRFYYKSKFYKFSEEHVGFSNLYENTTFMHELYLKEDV